MATTTYDADVVVVGAGPGGSTTAYHLAQAGLEVVALEKSQFPREKVCGDGLTPRGVKALLDMGIDPDRTAGWTRHRGLRVFGGGQVIEAAFTRGGMRGDLGEPDGCFHGFNLTEERPNIGELVMTPVLK